MRRYSSPPGDRESKDSAATGATAQLSSQRPESALQAQLHGLANGSPRHDSAQTLQRMADDSARTEAANRTGLPDALKAGIESLSGMRMDAVRVHYNSDKPAQLEAHAYARGAEIHLAPGQEEHLPHEAWHVVQQAQGRVRPTVQLAGGETINDDGGLEREADAMGALALQGGAAPAQLKAAGSAAPVLQLVKYIRVRGRILEVPDDYAKPKKERWADEDDFLKYHENDEEELPSVAAIRARRAKEQRTKDRKARHARVTPREMPESHVRKQIHYPDVHTSADEPADLVYRGMSVNNIRNLQKDKPSVFTAQMPDGTANAVQHIVHDSPQSPYLSFEAGGLGVSAGKYAAKPVGPDNKPLGVNQDENGFLKQDKSYTAESRTDHPGAKRIGYVGGITPDAGSGRLDVSTTDKADRELSSPSLGSETIRTKAKALAVADKEVLVKPGTTGIAKSKVPFVARIKEVTEAYYRRHLARQTSKKALGYYKPYGGTAVYSKIQLPPEQDGYKFHIPEDLRRTDEDSEDEMSDIESMDLGDYDSDTD